jgi:glycosyltransferase involved in cell wall biosynthesis
MSRLAARLYRAMQIVRKLPALPGRLSRLLATLNHLVHSVEVLRCESEAIKNSLGVDPELLEDFERWKRSTPIPDKPLVSVCVATYNRPELLTRRCIPSILNQTYQNIEVQVVGDHCPAAVQEAMAKISDPRVKFHNLPHHGRYPSNAMRRWMVAGSCAMNEALRRSQGDYITHLDDDDEYLPSRIGELVAFAKETKADFVWHPFWYESDEGWQVVPCDELLQGCVTTSSLFYRSWFKNIEWDLDAHLLLEPGDWNRVRRIKYFQSKMARYPQPLLRHYREQRPAAA